MTHDTLPQGTRRPSGPPGSTTGNAGVGAGDWVHGQLTSITRPNPTDLDLRDPTNPAEPGQGPADRAQPADPATEPVRSLARRAGRRWVRVVRRLLVAALACVLTALLGFGVLLGVTPSVADAQNRVAAQAAEHRATALSGALPSRVVAALIATEDSRFYSHQGIDPRGAIRGLSEPLPGGRDRGGASLDQQLVKLLYTGGRRNTVDQIEQIALAVKLDAHYSKDEILRMYLDTVYFGHGYYGIVTAAAGYFDRTPDTLTWAQASLLAGLVQAPSAYDPYEHLTAARTRQRHVLDRLVATGRLTTTQATQIAADPLNLR
ncbi:biosynthetic peptidoglycan transglycosylase [Frankia sp. R82]|uniref:biosynthetic peptidoglycan transglycosylase n=1 Tax=Frankia sp. R82 TaxID=2950553 RepID=UPI0020436AEE|nr:biosynthetic peptidoglycan transglycosylase [Frankia sp. R82]MCM3884284.1 transglycosylase domain-containing protein [Frankia sp. R82]